MLWRLGFALLLPPLLRLLLSPCVVFARLGLVGIEALRREKPLLAKLVRVVTPKRRGRREGSVGHAIKVSQWLALRAAVLRLAVSPRALPGTAAWFFPMVRPVQLAASNSGLIV
jgi:hypothetical protein